MYAPVHGLLGDGVDWGSGALGDTDKTGESAQLTWRLIIVATDMGALKFGIDFPGDGKS